jgi:hypothetical protein
VTIYFPDVSNHQAGLSLAGAVACIAKASEGTTFVDRAYAGFKAQARAMGIPFCAYHWLHANDVPGQARHAFSIVGRDVPLMIDDEDTGDGLDINRTLAFVRAYRALGGTVTLEYLPRWFWAQHGGPDLRPLAAAGLSLISSNYRPYSDTGAGWNPYGGMTPAIWQYTSSQPFNGMAVDFNAYKGTVEQLRALFNGTGGEDPDMWTEAEKQQLLKEVHDIHYLLFDLDSAARPPMSLAGKVETIRQAVTGPVQVEVELTEEQLAEVGAAAEKGASEAIDGATIQVGEG